MTALFLPSISIDIDIPKLRLNPRGEDVDSSVETTASQVRPEPPSTPDVKQANQQLVNGVETMKQALSKVAYDVAKQRPDIVDDVGFHYGGHKLATEPFQNTYKEDGSIDRSKPYVEMDAPQKYNSATSSAWDFTIENGQFRVYSKWMERSQYDWVTKGEASSDHTMVQAVSKEQMDVIQKTLNDNQQLMQGVKTLLNGLQGNDSPVANAPSLLLKQLIMDGERINLQEAGRAGRDYLTSNNAEKAGIFRRVAHALDSSLQISDHINVFV